MVASPVNPTNLRKFLMLSAACLGAGALGLSSPKAAAMPEVSFTGYIATGYGSVVASDDSELEGFTDQFTESRFYFTLTETLPNGIEYGGLLRFQLEDAGSIEVKRAYIYVGQTSWKFVMGDAPTAAEDIGYLDALGNSDACLDGDIGCAIDGNFSNLAGGDFLQLDASYLSGFDNDTKVKLLVDPIEGLSLGIDYAPWINERGDSYLSEATDETVYRDAFTLGASYTFDAGGWSLGVGGSAAFASGEETLANPQGDDFVFYQAGTFATIDQLSLSLNYLRTEESAYTLGEPVNTINAAAVYGFGNWWLGVNSAFAWGEGDAPLDEEQDIGASVVWQFASGLYFTGELVWSNVDLVDDSGDYDALVALGTMYVSF